MVRIFVSWSGDPTRKLAELLKQWLSDTVQEADLYVSSKDIGKGEKWTNSVTGALEEIDFGLILLTADNRFSPWVMFEAGALSKTGKALVLPLLCNIDPIDLPDPLKGRQSMTLSRDNFFSLASAVNARAERPLADERLKRSFARNWPEFEKALAQIDYGKAAEKKSDEDNKLARIEDTLAAILRRLPPEQALPVGQRPELTPIALWSAAGGTRPLSLGDLLTPSRIAEMYRAGGPESLPAALGGQLKQHFIVSDEKPSADAKAKRKGGE